MNRNPLPRRRASALLLAAAAALPLTALSAQEAQTPAEPAAQTPPAEAPQPSPPPPTPAPPEPAAAETPTTATPPPAAEPRATRRTTTTRTVTRSVAPARIVPAPVAGAPLVPAPSLDATVPTLPAEALPVEVLPEVAGAPTPAPAPAPAAVRQETGGSSMLPWLLGGLLLLGALAFFALRSRRRPATDVYDRSYEHHEVHEPVVEPLHQEAAVAAAPIAAAAVPAQGHPDIELRMRPLRAGVEATDARVEFELTVDNKGDAPAQDLRVSTWMLAAGSSQAERALVEPSDTADTPPVTIDAGEARTMEAAVALPTSHVDGDSVLPVVVADARYTLPDGREEHRSASFAVGIAVEGELAHFDMENPSGLHEGVEARPFDRG